MARGGRRRYDLAQPELDARVEELIERAREEFEGIEGADYVRQIVVSALRLARDGAARGELKLVNSTLKELRHSFRVFAPYKNVRKVAVFGSARTPQGHPDWDAAYAFAERMATEGWMTITGAGPGILRAAYGGAGREASFGVNIRLPYEQQANEVIEGDRKLINFRYFFTRKVAFVKEAHAIALFPGGFGTHDEGFEALTLIQTGKSEILPVVFVDSPGGSYWRDWKDYLQSHLESRGLIGEDDFSLFSVTDDVDEAVRVILDFYSNYHSSRYVDDRLVIRVRLAPDAAQLEALNDEFSDILAPDSPHRIEVVSALPRESDDVPHLRRVALPFDRRHMGRLRQLIDRLNALVPEHEAPFEASPHEIVEQELSPEAEVEEED